MPVTWIDYKGKRILYTDCRGLLTNEELIAVLEETKLQIQNSSTRVLSLTDVRDAYLSAEFMNHIKSNRDLIVLKTDRLALLGIRGLKKVLVDGFLHLAGSEFIEKAKLFETEDQAKEYLVS